MAVYLPTPELLASTSTTFSCSVNEFKGRRGNSEGKQPDDKELGGTTVDGSDGEETNYFKNMQWSPDGTCLLTNSADNILRAFIAPPDLLSTEQSPLILSPYTSYPSPEPVYTFSPYPFFSLQNQSTTLVLSSLRDLPIRLTNALFPSILATYPLVSPTTEAYLTPSSLIWTCDGTHFLTGTECLIALFDVSRNGSGPITRLPTIPSKRHNMKGGGVGMRGIVSCLSLQPSLSQRDPCSSTSLLAAGTWTRWVGLYDAGGLGGTVANWSIASAADSIAKISGGGVSQVLWSPCGRYLFVVERKTRGILVYDIRVTGRLVGWLDGRSAETNQRLGVEIFPGMDGSGEAEIWAGGMDGAVRVWKWRGVGEGQEGGEERLAPVMEWQAQQTAVTSVSVHPSGTVVATSSGQRSEPGTSHADSDTESDIESMDEGDRNSGSRTSCISDRSSKSMAPKPDNCVKIWRLGPNK